MGNKQSLKRKRKFKNPQSLIEHKFEKTLYVVYDRVTSERLGLHVPQKVFQDVAADAAATATGRRQAVIVKDDRDLKKARSVLLRIFSRMPLDSVEDVLNHGFLKGSGRVGRSTKLEAETKVGLAVVAHARHKFTAYDVVLSYMRGTGEGGNIKEKARDQIRGQLSSILKTWGSPDERKIEVVQLPERQALKSEG
ncbi:MAG: hypothetical protein M1830_007291 [Pleopsidium flavum]|nr:MAG: hypothetical protein M1830_007291 [Pleopsidium flavum]